MRLVARCVHHAPRNISVCAAGVRYRDVHLGGVGPCITLHGRPDRRSACARYEAVPDAQLEAEERAIDEAVGRFDMGQCPACGGALEKLDGERATIWVCKTHGAVARDCRGIGESE